MVGHGDLSVLIFTSTEERVREVFRAMSLKCRKGFCPSSLMFTSIKGTFYEKKTMHLGKVGGVLTARF